MFKGRVWVIVVALVVAILSAVVTGVVIKRSNAPSKVPNNAPINAATPNYIEPATNSIRPPQADPAKAAVGQTEQSPIVLPKPAIESPITPLAAKVAPETAIQQRANRSLETLPTQANIDQPITKPAIVQPAIEPTKTVAPDIPMQSAQPNTPPSEQKRKETGEKQTTVTIPLPSRK